MCLGYPVESVWKCSRELPHHKMANIMHMVLSLLQQRTHIGWMVWYSRCRWEDLGFLFGWCGIWSSEDVNTWVSPWLPSKRKLWSLGERSMIQTFFHGLYKRAISDTVDGLLEGLDAGQRAHLPNRPGPGLGGEWTVCDLQCWNPNQNVNFL